MRIGDGWPPQSKRPFYSATNAKSQAHEPYPGTYQDVRPDGTTLTLQVTALDHRYKIAGVLSQRNNPCFQKQKLAGIFDPASGSWLETFLGIGHMDDVAMNGYFLRERAGFAIKVGTEYYLPLLKTFSWRECEGNYLIKSPDHNRSKNDFQGRIVISPILRARGTNATNIFSLK